MNWKVPYVNYKIAYQNMKDEIHSALNRVMTTGDLILRKDVEEFEKNFAKFQGAKYGVGVNSCTDAMRLSLRLISRYHDYSEVIVSAHTFLATIDAIKDARYNPILVDVGSDYNINTKLIEQKITGATIAIMPVHLNGRCCNMDAIMDIANKYELTVIEDAAQGIGASYKGKNAGTFGLFGCFSFFPAKILGTIGDGGMILTDNKELADKLRAMRDYGRVKDRDEVIMYGQNSRLDNIHAAILSMKMKYLEGWIHRRREIARYYYGRLVQVETVSLPPCPTDGDYYDTFQNFAIMVHDRDELVEHLRSKGVETLVHWQVPIHKNEALGLQYDDLKHTEKISREVLSLPMYPELTNEQVEYVCDVIEGYYG